MIEECARMHGQEALPRVLPLLVSLGRARSFGWIYLDAPHRVRSGVQGILGRLASLTEACSSAAPPNSLHSLRAFLISGDLRCTSSWSAEAIVTGDHSSHEGGLRKELVPFKVGTSHLRVRRTHFLFGVSSLRRI